MNLYRGFSLSFVFWRCAGFQLFLPALLRLRGAMLFRGLRPSSIWGFPFWRLGLTHFVIHNFFLVLNQQLTSLSFSGSVLVDPIRINNLAVS